MLMACFIHWTPISTPISVEIFTLVEIYKNMSGDRFTKGRKS
jgi:hypothetical protein